MMTIPFPSDESYKRYKNGDYIRFHQHFIGSIYQLSSLQRLGYYKKVNIVHQHINTRLTVSLGKEIYSSSRKYYTRPYF